MNQAFVRLSSRIKRVPGAHAAYARVMALIQDSTGARVMRRYQRAAERAGIRPLSVADTETALRRRLAARGIGRQPRKKGDLHIFLAYGKANWEEVLPIALAPYGMVSAFEWRSRGYDERSSDWERRRDAMNADLLDTFERAHRLCPVDAVVGYLSGRNTSAQTVAAMARAGAVIFNFSWDDRLHFPGRRLGGCYTSPAELAAAVDLNLTNAPDSLVQYAVHGGLAHFWPLGADPAIHRPVDKPFDFDVSFVGQRYGMRPLFVAGLRRQGIEAATFGPGWSSGPLTTDDMVSLYSRSRINLGFAGIEYCRRLMNLKGRDFEVTMSGGLYLTEEHAALHRVFDVGREIVTYRDARDCGATIRRLLAHPDEAARIRAAGHARALRDHTWEARFDEVFRLGGLLEPSWRS